LRVVSSLEGSLTFQMNTVPSNEPTHTYSESGLNTALNNNNNKIISKCFFYVKRLFRILYIQNFENGNWLHSRNGRFTFGEFSSIQCSIIDSRDIARDILASSGT
jgi:hypothetical protein